MTNMTLLQEIKLARKLARAEVKKDRRNRWIGSHGWEVRVMEGDEQTGSPDIFFEGTGRIALNVLRREYQLARDKGYTQIWVEGRYDGANSFVGWNEMEYNVSEYWDVDLSDQKLYNRTAAVSRPQKVKI